MNLAAAVEYWARWKPTAIAIQMGEGTVSWEQLEADSRRIAASLLGEGVQRGDRVGILASNSLAWCELVIGVLRAGGVVVPLNLRATSSELTYMVDKVGCRAVAIDSGTADRFGPVAAERPDIIRIALDDRVDADVMMNDLRSGSGVLPAVNIDRDYPAVIAFTSGTTGYPKGATLTHGNILAMAETYTRWDNWGSDTVGLCFAPLAFTGGIVNALLGTHTVGGKLILEEFDPPLALKRIVSESVTAMTGVSIVYESIAALPEFAEADLSSVKTAVTGGAVVTHKLLNAWADKGVELRQAYGLTEAAGGSTLVPREHYRTKADTAGVPSFNTRIRVADENAQDVPIGVVGEILVNGPQVMAGYWGDPDATAEALRDGWLHTGDLGSLDEDGFLKIVDRKKDMIISGGLNVYPAEIERVLAEFPGVTESVAIGVPHERWGETVAVIVGGDVDLDDLYVFAKTHLSDYKVPRYISRAKERLPRSMSGKLLRRVLRDEFEVDAAHRTPAT